MTETKHQITQRKIRNGLKKQAEQVEVDKALTWKRLSHNPKDWEFTDADGYSGHGSQVELDIYKALEEEFQEEFDAKCKKALDELDD